MEEIKDLIQEFKEKANQTASSVVELKIDIFEINEIENLINKYKEQEKMIELMGDCIRCADLDEDIPCEHKFNCTECMIDYFRKKAKGE